MEIKLAQSEGTDGKGAYDVNQLHTIMAGSGDPYSALTPFRRRLLRALHDHTVLNALSAVFQRSATEIQSELEPLIAAGLVHERDGQYRPTFFIANATETALADGHARRTGQCLAEHLLDRWNQVERAYAQLSICDDWPLREWAFLFVGSRILDIGLLHALIDDGRQLPPAPPRPTADHPEARYFFWMIEGRRDQLGRYGQRAVYSPCTTTSRSR